MRSPRRTHLWTVPVLVVVLALGLAACGSDDDTSTTATTSGEATPPPTFLPGTTMANIQARGKLIVGIKYDQPGVGERTPEGFEGFDVEIAKLMAVGIFGGTVDDLGNDKIEFVEAVSANREPFLQNGNVDIVVASYTINDTRKAQVDFAGPYLMAHQDILVKSDDNSIKSVTDLNGKKVCSVQGSTSEKNVVARAPQTELTSFDTYSKCYEALIDGRVVAVTTDGPILAGFVGQSDGEVKVVNAPFTDEPYGIGLKKGDDAFRAFLNDRLEEIEANGQWAQAFEETLGELGLALPEPPPIDRYGTAGGPAATTTTVAGGATTTTAGGATTTTAATGSTTTTTP